MADEPRQRLISAMSGPGYTLADFLQGRGPNRLAADSDSSMWWATPPNALAPYAAPSSEFTTPRDLQRDRISQALGWDVSRPWHHTGMRALTELGSLPFGPRARPNLMQRLSDLPQAPRRDVLPSDLDINYSGNVWSVGRDGDYVTSHLSPQNNMLTINYSHLASENRGQGIGLAMYQRLIDEAHRRGYTVQSDLAVSPDAQRIYNALAERGYGITRNDSGSGSMFAVEPPAGQPARIPNPIRAYHGSPHQFDEFRLENIGTGEGAQAYGHGLYFAENEAVARGYRDALSGMVPDAWAQAMLRGERAAPNPGHMYEVNIHARPEQFLDWDRPLVQQSETVRNAVRDLVPNGETMRSFSSPGTFPLEVLDAIGDTPALRSERLLERGVVGQQYLDAGSRVGREGTRNYVLFQPELIEILRRYGIAAPIAGGAAASSLMGDRQPQY